MIGDKSWSGYDDSFADDIKDTIKSEYEKAVADRYDIANYVDFTNAAGSVTEAAKKSNDAMVLIIILLAVAGITYGVVAARKKTV